MKPMPLTTSNDRRRNLLDRAVGKRRCSPIITDYSYHSGFFGESSAHYMPVRVRSFWNISGDYLKDEARHDFWSEATLFSFITITAALPLINNVRALIEFVRAITPH
jgi:hypothetical protein